MGLTPVPFLPSVPQSATLSKDRTLFWLGDSLCGKRGTAMGMWLQDQPTGPTTYSEAADLIEPWSSLLKARVSSSLDLRLRGGVLTLGCRIYLKPMATLWHQDPSKQKIWIWEPKGWMSCDLIHYHTTSDPHRESVLPFLQLQPQWVWRSWFPRGTFPPVDIVSVLLNLDLCLPPAAAVALGLYL